MEQIKTEDFFVFATKSLKNKITETVDRTISKTNSQKGDYGEGATKYTFDNKKDVIVVFYKFTMITDTEPNCEFEIYHGTEINDFILDKLNEMKLRTLSRGQEFIWE